MYSDTSSVSRKLVVSFAEDRELWLFVPAYHFTELYADGIGIGEETDGEDEPTRLISRTNRHAIINGMQHFNQWEALIPVTNDSTPSSRASGRFKRGRLSWEEDLSYRNQQTGGSL